MGKGREETGPTGPGDKEYVQIKVDDYLRSLMGATGSANVSELVNKAITTLAWAHESTNDGRRIFATKEDLSGKEETQELVVNEKRPQ
jgi:hypothetical protein